MKKVFITLLICTSVIISFAQSVSKTENIKKLLELTGAGKLGVQMIDQMIGSFKSTYFTVSDEFWSDFQKEANAEALINLIIPIYDKYFTEEDLKKLTEFYQSTIGKKVITNQPLILRESMQAGQEWGAELAKKWLII